MAKSADPVQAARKAAIKREANRNRERKRQAHEARALRQDTSPLERQIQRLEARQVTLDQEDQEELQRLRMEVADVKRIKEEYIRKHPDQRNFVRGYEELASSSATAKASQSSNNDSTVQQLGSAFQSDQSAAAQATSRDPRWSIYYDRTFNPYGAPPPGMPYLEKPHAQLVQEGLLDAAKPPPLPEETVDLHSSGSYDSSDNSSVDDDLKDIIMPSGPPPIRLSTGTAHSTQQSSPARRPFPETRGGYAQSQGGRGRGSHRQGGRHGPASAQGRNVWPPQGPAGLPPQPPAGLPARPSVQTATFNTSQPSSLRPPGPPPAVPDGVVISAEPQLRDFRKESTAFVPAAIRKKQQEEKARMKRGLPGRVDAAPLSNKNPDSSSASYKDKPDLLKSLQAHLPSKDATSHGRSGDKVDKSNSSKKDYDRFLDEIGDLL
ncbi:hypothetical protein EX895_005484 [Sporisorium graminicola]|uniref:Wbp11/ELF5/Saf1 N-terminal domain-containing protein n=1 Tax=Sporisorium graminicola TaxID=280036 RepID=A0A4U7KQQ2_9BASI|nr:hypothetical protein EX895_005484 [Sporisorium graminicola]TKY85322.1 hypothetical protein EX895_005484 [Sporisorium graminicola]